MLKFREKWALPTFFSGGNQAVEAGESWLSKVEGVVSPVLASHGLCLVDAEWGREGRRWVLRFFVDKPGGVTVGDCQAASREAGDVLDVSGLIEPAYDLEFSSPGLDRQLRKDREFSWAVGKQVHCWVREPVEGQTEFSGRLLAASASMLTLEERDGGTRELPRALTTKARLEPTLGPKQARRK